jgi:anti-sigma-K factor RskA
MSNLPLRIGWRRRPSKARREAAERVLEENFSGIPSELGVNDQAAGEAGLGSELTSMRSLVQTLEQLPGQAWSPKLGTAPASRNARAGSRRPGLSGRLRPSPGLSAALATAALAFVVGALIHPFSGSDHPRAPVAPAGVHVVLKPLPGASAAGLAVAYMPGGGHMLLNVRDLPASAPGTYYELWLMTSNTDLVSVTSFRTGASGTASLRLVLPDDPRHYRYLDISVQHVGGRAGAISSDNVLRAALPT